jgi:hypothetical protein
MRKIILFLLPFIFLLNCSMYDDNIKTTTITGSVYNSTTSEPINGVKILTWSDEDYNTKVSYTDSSGYYAISTKTECGAGWVQLRFSKDSEYVGQAFVLSEPTTNTCSIPEFNVYLVPVESKLK